jgi:methylated-DNA-[protein]-cysteine S-methyltransferase
MMTPNTKPQTPTVPRSSAAATGTTRARPNRVRADVATWQGRLGPFTAVVRDGVVLASGWTSDVDWLVALVAAADRPSELRERRTLGDVSRAVDAYDAGAITAIDAIPVHQHTGAFHHEVREQLRAIPPGAPLSYAELAAAAGRPRAARAAGTACARNPTSLFVPCHRAVGSNGSLHGFGWGLALKAALLDHECVHATLGSDTPGEVPGGLRRLPL